MMREELGRLLEIIVTNASIIHLTATAPANTGQARSSLPVKLRKSDGISGIESSVRGNIPTVTTLVGSFPYEVTVDLAVIPCLTLADVMDFLN